MKIRYKTTLFLFFTILEKDTIFCAVKLLVDQSECLLLSA